MPSSRLEPLPLEAVRDLLGVARALYSAEKARGAGARRLAELEAVGRDLASALDLARDTPPNSMGQRAAWQKAERALEKLAELVDVVAPLQPVLEAAGARVRRRR